jgi:SsrA-binding protein
MLKMQIATARGKKLHDKRDDLKQKTLKRESEQALKNYK